MSQSIAVLGSDQVPLIYQVPVPGTLTALSASGTYDGTSAAAFQPCLSFYDSDGNLLARATAPVVAAGESAEVSWFPHVGGSDGDGWKFDTDNEGGWGLVVANDTGPDGYGLEFSTGSSDKPTGFTGDGGFTVDTEGAVSVRGGSGITLDPGGHSLDVSGEKIANGAAGTAPTDYAIVSQVTGLSRVTALDGITGPVTLVEGANVTITDNDPTAGHITIAAGASALEVTDGSTTVSPVTEIDFTAGATVTDAGGGIAQVSVASGITFDTDNVGDWLDIETTGVDGGGNGIYLHDTSLAGSGMTLLSDAGEVIVSSPVAGVQLASGDANLTVENGYGVGIQLGVGGVFALLDHTGSLLLEVTEDGTYHIQTGATWVADL